MGQDGGNCVLRIAAGREIPMEAQAFREGIFPRVPRDWAVSPWGQCGREDPLPNRCRGEDAAGRAHCLRPSAAILLIAPRWRCRTIALSCVLSPRPCPSHGCSNLLSKGGETKIPKLKSKSGLPPAPKTSCRLPNPIGSKASSMSLPSDVRSDTGM